jgi:hypothetical protein
MGILRVVVRSPVLLASDVERSTPKPLSPWRMFLGKRVTKDLTCKKTKLAIYISPCLVYPRHNKAHQRNIIEICLQVALV